MLPLAVLTVLISGVPEVATLSRAVDAQTLEVRWQPLGSVTLAEPFARLTVANDESFAGVVLPGTRTVAIVSVEQRARDLSFASSLTLVSPSAAPRRLASQVVLASKPVLMGNRLFVERGEAGPPPPEGLLRVDQLTVTEVDVGSGRLRPVFSTKGFWAHLGGVFGRELVLYVAGPDGAALVAVHVDSLAVRTVKARLPPLAHDFVVDARRHSVAFTIADLGVERWFIEQVDLRTAQTQRVAEGETVALLPTLLPRGLAFMPTAGAGLHLVNDGALVLAPRGDGFERVRLVNEGLIVGLHEVPGALPAAFVVREVDGSPVGLATPPNALVDVAGLAR